MSTHSPRFVQIGALSVDLVDGRVFGPQAQRLTPLLRKLLLTLARARGATLSREQLYREVWGHRQVLRTRSLDSAVRRLRGTLEPEPSDPRYLLSVYSQGYRLVTEVPVPAEQDRDLRRLRQRLDRADLVTLVGSSVQQRLELVRGLHQPTTLYYASDEAPPELPDEGLLVAVCEPGLEARTRRLAHRAREAGCTLLVLAHRRLGLPGESTLDFGGGRDTLARLGALQPSAQELLALAAAFDGPCTEAQLEQLQEGLFEPLIQLLEERLLEHREGCYELSSELRTRVRSTAQGRWGQQLHAQWSLNTGTPSARGPELDLLARERLTALRFLADEGRAVGRHCWNSRGLLNRSSYRPGLSAWIDQELERRRLPEGELGYLALCRAEVEEDLPLERRRWLLQLAEEHLPRRGPRADLRAAWLSFRAQRTGLPVHPGEWEAAGLLFEREQRPQAALRAYLREVHASTLRGSKRGRRALQRMRELVGSQTSPPGELELAEAMVQLVLDAEASGMRNLLDLVGSGRLRSGLAASALVFAARCLVELEVPQSAQIIQAASRNQHLMHDRELLALRILLVQAWSLVECWEEAGRSLAEVLPQALVVGGPAEAVTRRLQVQILAMRGDLVGARVACGDLVGESKDDLVMLALDVMQERAAPILPAAWSSADLALRSRALPPGRIEPALRAWLRKLGCVDSPHPALLLLA